jgi:4'-phosphopantetheinyl transferase
VIYSMLLEGIPSKIISDKAHFLGEELLAGGLLREVGINYRNEPVILNPWGKPSLKNHPGVQYNISHSENCIACVISDKYIVGIDVEKVRAFNPYAAKRVCSPDELQRIYSSDDSDREFFRYWTLKESYIKAIGKGLSYPMKNANFEIEPGGKIYSGLHECSFQLMEDMNGFIMAVCYSNISERR